MTYRAHPLSRIAWKIWVPPPWSQKTSIKSKSTPLAPVCPMSSCTKAFIEGHTQIGHGAIKKLKIVKAWYCCNEWLAKFSISDFCIMFKSHFLREKSPRIISPLLIYPFTLSALVWSPSDYGYYGHSSSWFQLNTCQVGCSFFGRHGHHQECRLVTSEDLLLP